MCQARVRIISANRRCPLCKEENEHVVVIHISRRTNLTQVRDELFKKLGTALNRKIEILMDHKGNREKYERQLADAGIRAER
jgi:hypothetical protein